MAEHPKEKHKIAVIGGGAAGFFGAIQIASEGTCSVTLLEKGKQFLSKVKISGGGRCNVTHHCLDPETLSKNYPRGERELRWAFETFGPKDTIRWYEDRGVALKTEADGRMFPITDSSETILQTLFQEAKKVGVKLKTTTEIHSVTPTEDGRFQIKFKDGEILEFDKVLFATGSGRKAWGWLQAMGHTILEPVPSLFTFKISDPRLENLSGLSFEQTECSLVEFGYSQIGPTLITHWGLSGPAILKLSAKGARELFQKEYDTILKINFIPGMKKDEVRKKIEKEKGSHPSKSIVNTPVLGIPRRYWERILEIHSIDSSKKWSGLSSKDLHEITEELTDARFRISGKGEFKDEFVTCGGVSRKEVNFKTMESKVVPGVYFAGEVLDVDGVTGGFNFQNAWTTSYIAARGILESF
ncbi:NAD(P)/FAD-dependent oxidoreductase [Leptospira yasudae]|uniref:NAD(P)/FAD-dependent oxidoreductase n=1 Tax=Leptospira yasudae TaxID=2202201 RepID=A0A6N4R0B9_9LEPT|nr:NAD(P)/FAD-dependent oxidoreductase [Leptospira yasudae]TGL76481.1 NAD(P)/FAD-dependent oxidoreductase [Leptospira yasudae]TGL83404.1 NAD(P)/FAD-dependent oxidoreductase [Leptospira yasudae]TGL89448.1 NAD(P)/FAD-dependent oxidoreductase [Leptospira yasudae]